MCLAYRGISVFSNKIRKDARRGNGFGSMKESLLEISGKFLGGRREAHRTADQGNSGEQIKRYKERMESGAYFQIVFEKAEADGTLSKVEDNVIIRMEPQEINGDVYDLRFKSQKLADPYYVRVVSVDEEHSVVWVSHNRARVEMRPDIEKEINSRLKDKKSGMVRVKGKVMRIQSKTVQGESVDTGVWLDLCGVGILGFVYIGDWAQTFTPMLRGEVSYGDVIEVCVKERKVRKQKKSDVVYYACSRKELADNPWDKKSLSEKYHVGDIVKIKCLTLKEGHWFGEINGLKDIQVFAEYPSASRQFAIIPGMEYMGKIYYMNTAERSLKARVFQALTLEGYGTAEGKEENA